MRLGQWGLVGVTCLFLGALEPSLAASTEFQGPMTIVTGGTYRGSWQSTDPDVPAVRIMTSEPVIIDGATIRGAGNLIEAEDVTGARLIVRNTSGFGLDPGIAGRTKDRFVAAASPAELIIENNLISGTSGVYVLGLSGSGADATIRVRFNRFKNIDGRVSDGNGFDMDNNEDVALVQAIQLDKVRNARRVEIAWNEIINEPYQSRVEDNINIYLSSGTAENPILIHDNYIYGGFPTDPKRDGYSGGGILIDNGGAHVRIYANQVIATTNHGIAIAGGHDNDVYDNTVVSSGLLPDGSKIAAQNVGVYVWNSYGNSPFRNNLVHDNSIGWANRQGGRNDTWFHDCLPTDCRDNRSLPHPITLAVEQEEAVVWNRKLASAGVVLGPRSAGPDQREAVGVGSPTSGSPSEIMAKTSRAPVGSTRTGTTSKPRSFTIFRRWRVN